MIFGDGHHAAPVVVNGGGYAQPPMYNEGGYVGGAPVVNSGPGFFGMIFWGFVNLLTLIAFIAALVWIFVKIRNYIRNNR